MKRKRRRRPSRPSLPTDPSYFLPRASRSISVSLVGWREPNASRRFRRALRERDEATMKREKRRTMMKMRRNQGRNEGCVGWASGEASSFTSRRNCTPVLVGRKGPRSCPLVPIRTVQGDPWSFCRSESNLRLLR